jgi:hypothetical protein
VKPEGAERLTRASTPRHGSGRDVVTESQPPAGSALEGWRLQQAYHCDAFSAPLSRGDLSVTDLFAAIFGHHPPVVKAALLVRNAMVRAVGSETSPATEVLSPIYKPYYEVGEKIGRWRVFYLSAAELIAGGDESHLDFRVSLLTQPGLLTLTTVCTVNNRWGGPYLRVVRPFHRAGVRAILNRAVSAGRI